MSNNAFILSVYCFISEQNVVPIICVASTLLVLAGQRFCCSYQRMHARTHKITSGNMARPLNKYYKNT